VELAFPGGVEGTATASMWSPPRIVATLTGEQGSITVWNPLAPHVAHRLFVRGSGRRLGETVPGRSTYAHQLEAFVAAVETGAPFPTTVDDAVANMRVIDAAYVAAGLEPRHGTVA
jgi:predicted dehydrogenase